MDAATIFGANLKAIRDHRKLTQQQLADELGTSKGYISDLERAKRSIPPGATIERWAATLGLEATDLLPRAPEGAAAMVRVIGEVGGNPDTSRVYTTASDAYEFAPIPPGGTEKAVGLMVKGRSMRGFADDGALIYFEDQRTPPTRDMLGDIVVVETEDGQVLLKRLLRGSEDNLYDLESVNGEMLKDRRIRWAANITAIIPPKQARLIIKKEHAA